MGHDEGWIGVIEGVLMPVQDALPRRWLTAAQGTMIAPPRAVVPQDLAEFRRQYGLSQRAFGTLLGVQQSTLRCWETGQMRIENPVMVALALEGARQVLAAAMRGRAAGRVAPSPEHD